MSKTRTIVAYHPTVVTVEGLTAEVLKPGHLVAINSDGKYVKQATGSVAIVRAVAREDDMQGKGIEDDYASGARMRASILRSGDRAYLRAAASLTTSIGTYLECDDAGRVKLASAGVRLFQALENVTAATADDLVLCVAL